MIATREIPAQTVTESAQIKRRQVVAFVKDKITGKVTFSGPQIRQAFALSAELTDELTENRMALLVYSDDPDQYEIKFFPRMAGKVDLSAAIVDPHCQLNLLEDWYRNLYRSIQSNDTRLAYQVFKDILPGFGITDTPSDMEPPNIFMAYEINSRITKSFEAARNIADIINQTLIVKPDLEPELGFQKTNQITHALWNLIGTMNPDFHDHLRNQGYAIETLSSSLTGSNLLDAEA